MQERIGLRKAFLIILVSVALIGAWSAGTFDNFLWRVHLNSHDCIQNGFGAVFCGDAAERYQQRFNLTP